MRDPRRQWLVDSLGAALRDRRADAAKARARGARLGEPHRTYCETLATTHERAAREYERELASLGEERYEAAG